jgi:hypothetical protein
MKGKKVVQWFTSGKVKVICLFKLGWEVMQTGTAGAGRQKEGEGPKGPKRHRLLCSLSCKGRTLYGAL